MFHDTRYFFVYITVNSYLPPTYRIFWKRFSIQIYFLSRRSFGKNLFAAFSAVILSTSFSVAIYRFFSIQVTNIILHNLLPRCMYTRVSCAIFLKRQSQFRHNKIADVGTGWEFFKPSPFLCSLKHKMSKSSNGESRVPA